MNPVTTGLNRISKIDNSAVIPPRHKWTEVGVLPKDWTVQSLRSCLLSAPSYGINKAAVPFDDDLPTYLRITDISEDGQFRPSPRVSVKHTNGQAFFLNEGDLVLARTGASVGKSYLYNTNDGPLVFAGFLIRISPNSEKLQPTFLAYYLQSNYFWNWVATMSIRSGQPGINGQEYGELRLPLPPIHEQSAIAEVLSDVDGLINALDALIAKKQAVKQATMQQLLTGKTRLPDFSGAWEPAILADFGVFRSGSGFPLKYQGIQSGDYPFFKVSDLSGEGNQLFMNRANHYISEDVRRKLSAIKFEPGSVVFAKIGAAIFLERKRLLSQESCLDNNMMAFTLTDDQMCSRFFYYMFLRTELGQLASTTALPALSGRQIGSISVLIPPPEEQRAIATVLTDMDAEIATLELRRDKTIAIKQGMMQQLLTGRVRLVKSDAIA